MLKVLWKLWRVQLFGIFQRWKLKSKQMWKAAEPTSVNCTPNWNELGYLFIYLFGMNDNPNITVVCQGCLKKAGFFNFLIFILKRLCQGFLRASAETNTVRWSAGRSLIHKKILCHKCTFLKFGGSRLFVQKHPLGERRSSLRLNYSRVVKCWGENHFGG